MWYTISEIDYAIKFLFKSLEILVFKLLLAYLIYTINSKHIVQIVLIF